MPGSLNSPLHKGQLDEEDGFLCGHSPVVGQSPGVGDPCLREDQFFWSWVPLHNLMISKIVGFPNTI